MPSSAISDSWKGTHERYRYQWCKQGPHWCRRKSSTGFACCTMRRHLRPHWNQRLSARDDSEAAQHLSQSKWQTWQFWDALLAIAAGFGCGWMPKTKVKHNVMRAPAACRSSAANLPFPSCQASFSAPSHASYLERYRTTSEPGSTFFVVNDSVLKSNPWRVNRSVNSIKPPKKTNN